VIRSVTPENAEEFLLEELLSSPLFGLRFRQNAARTGAAFGSSHW